jgi:hypothetical protein
MLSEEKFSSDFHQSILQLVLEQDFQSNSFSNDSLCSFVLIQKNQKIKAV